MYLNIETSSILVEGISGVRRCNRCGVPRSLDEFHYDSRGRLGRGYRCKRCNAAAAKEWCDANPERARANATRRSRNWRLNNPQAAARQARQMRERGRAFIDAAKEGLPCSECGDTFAPCAMDWHHRDPAEKKFTIGGSYNRSTEALAAEIAKCDLVCANCHRVMTQYRN